jgi:eukaryotic-like serine/threonine-protein kinase
MSEDEKLQRFGRYLILDHLVDGGMAKICRARFLGEQADKVVAIKMIQQQFSKDTSFKTMFMDEIKVTFGLNHPNIAATYDYGVIDDQLFTAMEYVEGRNLKEYLDKLVEKKLVFPVEISVYIVAQSCLGLSYAHNFTDKLTGKEMNIIHRDISPHNIMLTFDGAVKVIDFGIAKAESNSEATQAGTIKGKLSYLAPEYLEYEGGDLDHRYDQFAVGITLWELLCRQKLFKAKNDLAVLKKIQECRVPPPSTINPNVPKDLDEVVLKALSKDRNNRYENMNDFHRALNKVLVYKYPEFNPTNTEYFAKELFKEEITKDRTRMLEFGKIDIRPYLDDLKRDQEGGTTSKASVKAIQSDSSGGSVSQVDRTSRTIRQELDMDFEEELENNKDKLKLDVSSTRVTRVNKNTKSNENNNQNNTRVSTKTNITKINKNLIKNKKRQNDKSGSNIKLITIVALFVFAYLNLESYQEYLPQFIKDQLVKSRQPASKDKNKLIEEIEEDDKENYSDIKEDKNIKRGRLLIKNFELGSMEVYINNDMVSDFNQFEGIKLNLNINYNLRVERKGYFPYSHSFILNEENTKSVIDLSIESANWKNTYSGQLEASNYMYNKGILKYQVRGASIERTLPIKDPVEIPVGVYNGKVSQDDDPEKCVVFEIEDMMLTTLTKNNHKNCDLKD